MAESETNLSAKITYPLGAATRLTGLSAEVLRAWERRYGAVQPPRTPGGTRRYRPQDLERLRLLKAAVDAGHRIGEVARLDDAELRQRASANRETDNQHLEQTLAALKELNSTEAQRLLASQLSALGPVRFANDFALPLVREIGERWETGRMSIASEHLASGLLRAMLGSALQPNALSLMGPRIVFATPSGERHELGLQMAALTAMGAGAAPIYLTAELPVEELIDAVERTRASALALSLITIDRNAAAKTIAALRAGIAPEVQLWVGGAAAAELAPIEGVECIQSLEAFEGRVVRLGFEKN
ncbi:MAG: MerR family transcriptional regulator [Deltaproteobacteria bacterium]|jgi:DNA-binding transcriptional MerR regulator/methylmalonyl-CoA mutase cobalamin-binding subunit|nr:MerR family transcriptional regulator [Deltaproteobacteria bacterium]